MVKMIGLKEFQCRILRQSFQDYGMRMNVTPASEETQQLSYSAKEQLNVLSIATFSIESRGDVDSEFLVAIRKAKRELRKQLQKVRPQTKLDRLFLKRVIHTFNY